MSNNKEKRIYQNTVHIFIGLQRPSKQGLKACVRHVIKEDEEKDLKIFEAKLKVLGGEWRIHRTVNARDTKTAYNWFMKYLIDYPERVSACESIWRTALLQSACKAERYFMLDIDTEKYEELSLINYLLCEAGAKITKEVKSPKGYHYITEPFDTREVEALDYVTLIRDGYYYVKTVGENTEKY
jgi:hypothetical protein